MATVVKRFPRPAGLTSQMVNYHKVKEESEKEVLLENAKKFLINNWFMNNGNVSGNQMTINQLSLFINSDTSEINNFLREHIVSSKIWDKEKVEDLQNGLLSIQLAWAMEDRLEAATQAEVIKASQNGQYKPFISSEVRQTLDLKMKATSNMVALTSRLLGAGTTNIFGDQYNNNNTQNINYLSQEQALQMINDKFKSDREDDNFTEVNEARLVLEENYDITSLPSVNAIEQTGIDTSKESLETNKLNTKIKQTIDKYNEDDELDKLSFHDIRRALSQGVNEDDDPEFVEIID